MLRFTPPYWWECDVAHLTDSDLLWEYEIKLSVADWRRDFGKERTVRLSGESQTRIIVKHNELALRTELSPSRYYFVIPAELKDAVKVPEYAGLIVANNVGTKRRVTLETVKQAPTLHRHRRPKIKDQMLTAAYWRLHTIQAKGQCSCLNSTPTSPSSAAQCEGSLSEPLNSSSAT